MVETKAKGWEIDETRLFSRPQSVGTLTNLIVNERELATKTLTNLANMRSSTSSRAMFGDGGVLFHEYQTGMQLLVTSTSSTLCRVPFYRNIYKEQP